MIDLSQPQSTNSAVSLSMDVRFFDKRAEPMPKWKVVRIMLGWHEVWELKELAGRKLIPGMDETGTLQVWKRQGKRQHQEKGDWRPIGNKGTKEPIDTRIFDYCVVEAGE